MKFANIVACLSHYYLLNTFFQVQKLISLYNIFGPTASADRIIVPVIVLIYAFRPRCLIMSSSASNYCYHRLVLHLVFMEVKGVMIEILTNSDLLDRLYHHSFTCKCKNLKIGGTSF